MLYVPPSAVASASWVGASAYGAPLFRLVARWSEGLEQWVSLGGETHSRAGVPAVVLAQFFVNPVGVAPGGMGKAYALHDHAQAYRPPQFVAHASWLGAEPYGAVSGAFLRASWDNTRTVISPAGFDHSDVPAPHVYGSQFIRPSGWDTLKATGKHYATFPFEYPFPQWTLDASWVGKAAYVPPLGSAANAAWRLPSEAKQLAITGWSSMEFGWHTAERRLARVTPPGIEPPPIDKPNVRNAAAPLRPGGFSAQAFGRPTIYNWRQYVPLVGFVATLDSKLTYVQGGVKEVALNNRGIASALYGRPVVINTTANQEVAPKGMAPPLLGLADVSPRTLWPRPIYATGMGFALVQFPPQPKGWQSSTFGYATVEYKTKQVRPGGIDSYVTGFGVVRDRAQRVLHQASAVTALFGDVAVRVTTQRLRVDGWYSMESGTYGEVRSNLRHLLVRAIATPGMGDAVIYNKTPSLAPAGMLALAWGWHSVGWRIRSIGPAGIGPVFGYFPAPSLWQTPSLGPLAIAPPAIPRHTVWPAVREVGGLGYKSERLGLPVVGFSYRRIVAEGKGIAGASYGLLARVEHADRKLVLLGRSYLEFGLPWVSSGERTLGVLGIREVDMSRHAIGGTQHLGPEGYEATRWLTRIVPEAREVYPKTFGASYGWPTVEHHTRYLRPAGITTYPEAAMHWGVARFWNRRQIIRQDDDPQSGLYPPSWPKWMLIENRNKVIGGMGYVATRMTGPLVELGGRAVLVQGIGYPVLPEYQKTGSVTHRVRPLPIEGMEPPYMSGWAVVHNKAAPILPPGLVATKFGTAEVVNTRRYYKLQGFDSFASGYPFIAYRIRELTFESRYGIEPPRIALPRVFLYTNYIEPKSIDAPDAGAPALDIFFRRITPRWTQQERFGYPALRNLTPELGQRGRVTEEWGNAFVRLEWRPVDPEGTNTQLFGRTRISDRKQTITVAGANYMLVSDKVTVRRVGADPVVTQYIDLRVFITLPGGEIVEADEGHGIPYPWPAMGTPDMTKGYIFHRSANKNGDMQEFGKPYITANTIRVEPGYGDPLNVGEPYVSLKIRQIDVLTLGELVVASTPSANGSMGSWGKPAISPHTIYAVLEAPAQALRNHNRRAEELRAVNTGARLGAPRVSQYLGKISPRGIAETGALGGTLFWGVGRPSLTLKRQYVLVQGFNMQRLGWPVIPGPQTIDLEQLEGQIGPSGEWGVTYGRPTVGHPPYVGPVYVKPAGLAAPAIARHTVDHFHRTMQARGFFSQAMGASGAGSSTYMPQNLTVGFKRPTIPVGIAAREFDGPWVSHRVRTVQPEGTDFFLSEYDIENFKKRMRVRRADDFLPAPQRITTAGHQSSACGWQEVRPMRHYIRPDGNSEQYRKGAF